MKGYYDQLMFVSKPYWERNNEKEIPIFGSLATGNVNAMAIAVPDSKQHIVILEDEIFVYCLLVCKLIARCFPFKSTTSLDGRTLNSFSTDIDKIDKQIYDTKEIIPKFQDLLCSYIFKGKPSEAKSYILEAPYDDISNSLRITMECFIMGHEFGHLIMNHVGDKRVSAKFPKTHQKDEILYAWQDEIAS